MKAGLIRLLDQLPIVLLSLRQQLGRRFLLVPVFVLAWPVFTTGVIYLLGGSVNFGEEDIQNILLGLPLYIMSIGIGVGLITNEIEQRTLEVTYTIPGGARRVWILKLISAALLIVVAELLMALSTWLVYTSFRPGLLPAVFRGAIFFLVLAMGIGALLKSELMAAIVCGGIFMFILVVTVDGNMGRWSPLFDTAMYPDTGPLEMRAWMVQNYIGYTLVMLGLASLAFSRAQRREQLLG